MKVFTVMIVKITLFCAWRPFWKKKDFFNIYMHKTFLQYIFLVSAKLRDVSFKNAIFFNVNGVFHSVSSLLLFKFQAEEI
jgi:hypothetical protein